MLDCLLTNENQQNHLHAKDHRDEVHKGVVRGQFQITAVLQSSVRKW